MSHVPYITIVFIFGAVVGSFCNVCVVRLPKKEDIVLTPSHCTKCGTRLRFYELVPLLSYVSQRGKCGTCCAKISAQYPIAELLNAVLWVLVYTVYGTKGDYVSLVFGCIFAGALLTVSIIDIKTYEIPPQLTLFIALLGVFHAFFNYNNFYLHLVGMCVLFGILYLLFALSNGKAIGGGDVKLMGACGLFLGLANGVLALVLACFLGSIIHVLLMRFFGAGRVLAMGPYISAGALISFLYGDVIINKYLNFIGF